MIFLIRIVGLLLFSLMLWNGDSIANTAVTFKGQIVPGALIIGTTTPGSIVNSDTRTLRVSPEGTFLLGIGRNASGNISVSVTDPNKTNSHHVLSISSRKYDIQRIDGLPEKQVSPDLKTLERIEQEFSQIKEIRERDSKIAYFTSGFRWPVEGPITGVFGTQRILNGKPRSPHNGVDIAAPKGTIVVAMSDGIVTLAHEDMFYTGMTIMLDHGHGLASIYVHMSEILVEESQIVTKGTPIGRVGSTGRSTGPHLHWGVTLFTTHLDPALLVGSISQE